MTKTIKVKLTIDRNGRVDTIDPEAAQVEAGDTISYRLKEPGSESNWRFMGIQLARHAGDFSSVTIDDDGRTLNLRERSGQTESDTVTCTLLYTLADSTYIPPGDIRPDSPVPLPVLPVHAYDPLILNKN